MGKLWLRLRIHRDRQAPHPPRALTSESTRQTTTAAEARTQGKQQRSWTYYSLSGEPLLKVNRTDDGNGKRTLWQQSLIKGTDPVDLTDDCRP